ncbi:MAG: undecaprenyl-phosphate glucose phosphotransferase, partial [Burkholderiales bacterium]
MFDDRTYKRTFYSAPQSVTSLVAAFLEPSITVLTFLFATVYADEVVDRPALTLCLLVFALTFPGRNRFRDNLIAAGVDILSSWITLVAILALCGYATRSLHYFENEVLLDWLIVTPILQWLAVWVGKLVVQRLSARSAARRTAIVVGAGALGVKVAKALNESADYGVDFIGYFDDRTDERLHEEASAQRLGGLKDVAAFATERGVREVYITLPLGSQPRIVELLEEVQGTTASLFFVPDVFGISIIQGRLQDMNGVPVVGICET